MGPCRECRCIFASPRLRLTLAPQERCEGDSQQSKRYPIDQTKGGLPPGDESHIDEDMAAAACGEAFEQPLEHFCAGRVIVGDIGHQLPALLPDLECAAGLADTDGIVLRFEQRTQERGEILRSTPPLRERLRDLVKILHADQFSREMQEIAGVLRSEQLHHDGRGGLHIFHGVVAVGFFQPRLRPAFDRQRRRGAGIEQRRLEMTREHQPRIRLERMIVFVVITLEPVLAVDALLGADEAEVWIAQRHAVIGVPAPQHRARDLARNAADRGALPDPARRRIADPGLAVGLVHVFDMDAADPVREIMILRRRHRRRQMIDTEFHETWEETFLLLAAKHPEDKFSGIRRAAPRHHGENEPGEISVVEIGDAAPFQPLCLLGAVRRCAHVPP